MLSTRKQQIAGWIMSAVLAVFLIGLSAVGKFTDFPDKEKMFQHIGFDIELVKKIGVLEVIITILFLIPQTSFIGAILLTGYLGGATVTHVRVGDPFIMPVLMGVFMWVALALRRPEIWRLAAGRRPLGSN